MNKYDFLQATSGGLDIFERDMGEQILFNKSYRFPVLIQDDNNASLKFYNGSDRYTFYDFGSNSTGDVFSWLALRYDLDPKTQLDEIIKNACTDYPGLTYIEQSYKLDKDYFHKYGIERSDLPKLGITLTKDKFGNDCFAIPQKEYIKLYYPDKGKGKNYYNPKGVTKPPVWNCKASKKNNTVIIVEGPKDGFIGNYRLSEKKIDFIALIDAAVKPDSIIKQIEAIKDHYKYCYVMLDQDDSGWTCSQLFNKHFAVITHNETNDLADLCEKYQDNDQLYDKIKGYIAEAIDKDKFVYQSEDKTPSKAKEIPKDLGINSNNEIDKLLVDLESGSDRTTAVEFPSDALYEPLRKTILECVDKYKYPIEMYLPGAMGGLAASIGGRFMTYPKRQWPTISNVWFMLIAESGKDKTSSTDLFLEPIDEYQQGLRDDIAMHNQDPENKNKKPMPSIIMSNTTPEGAARAVLNHPPGVLLYSDEISGWLNGFDKYTGGKGNEKQFWLSAFNGKSYNHTRSTQGLGFFIPKLSISILGGIQPEVVQDIKLDGSGFHARILPVIAPKIDPIELTFDDVDESLLKSNSDIIKDILSWEMDEDGKSRIIDFSPEGKKAFKKYWQQIENMKPNEPFIEIRSVLSKSQIYLSRFSLIQSVYRSFGLDNGLSVKNNIGRLRIEAEDVQSAAMLTEYFTQSWRVLFDQVGRAEQIYFLSGFGKSLTGDQKGRIAKIVINEPSVKVAEFARKMGIDRTTIYSWNR